MRNVIILGSGRSGTSMVAGVLSKAGYYMGDKLYPARHSNPKGFFEAPEINRINEKLIAMVIPKRPLILGRWFFRDRPKYGQRWLAQIPLGTEMPSPIYIVRHIEKVTKKEPFCFKDPRFCYTLPVWRPYLKNTVFLCVFRHPTITVKSILKECNDMRYLRSLSINFKKALNIWTLMYQHILKVHRWEGRWVFIHFNQVLEGKGLDRIERVTGAKVDRKFPEPSLNRTARIFDLSLDLPLEVMSIYEELCKLAEYDDPYLKV